MAFSPPPSSEQAAPSPDPNAAGGATEYSTTNTQVFGVDEADFVKNDAEHVYVLTPTGLRVIDAWPPEETREIARVSVPGTPRRMFLAGDRLVVYANTPASTENPYGGFVIGGGSPSRQGCTYGYGCRFTSEGGGTLVLVFDVSEPAQPRELQRYRFSGGFVATRRVGPHVYTVVHDQAGAVSALPGMSLGYTATDPVSLEQEYTAKVAEMDRAVDALPKESFLPWFAERARDGTERGVPSCDGAYAAAKAGGQSYVSLVAFDLDRLEAPTRTLLATKPGFVYASGKALYLAVDGVDGTDAAFYTGSGIDERSTIHKLALDGTRTSYAGSASIRGHVLNQFSMDEANGVLRVATSSGTVPTPGVSSNVTTLVEDNGTLVRQGELTGLAPNEDIRSVRFDGERGFVVTFKKTDPLFVIDLANPRAPKVLGELEIPGFSTYMHLLDENHLLAVGFDADDQGSFAYFDGIQIQIFDVTDLTRPALAHKLVIGTRGSGSEALMNHLAFNYFPSKGLLALPMTICDGGDNGVFGTNLSFSGLMVLDVSVDAGISERGRMPFIDAASVGARTGSSCGQWWTNSTSLVKRSIFMDDFAIGISDARLNTAPLSDLSSVVATVPLSP